MIDYLDDILNDTNEVVHSNEMVPTLLVDCSYVTYHSMFSAWNTFKEQFSDLCPVDDIHKFDPTKHDEFKRLLGERFNRAVMTAPSKVYPFIESSNIVFAKDCSKKDIWRIEYFSEYKQERRDQKPEDKPFNFSGSFKYIYDNVIPSYEEDGAVCINAPASEGDDIIATLVKNKISDRFIILASDRDLLQLVSDKVIMINVAGDEITFANELSLPQEELEKINFDGKNYILIKAMMGDRSDGIPQIHKRCGIKTAIKYFFDKGLLQEKMKNDPNIPAIINKNLQIMDFDYIPKEINDAIMEKYNSAKG